MLQAALAWAVMHPTESVDHAAGYPTGCVGGGDRAVPIAGDGAPLVAEFAVCEFGAAVGLNSTAAKALVGQAVELRYRLPRCWARVAAGQVPAWKARLAARETMTLTKAAAGEVDQGLAPVLHASGVVTIRRLVEEAHLRYADPDQVPTEDYQPDGRHADVDTRQCGYNGTFDLHATVDLADGLDLDTALAECAEWLKLQGSTDTLDARRAQALGIIARGEYPQPDTTETTQSVTTPSDATQPGTAATTDSSSSASPRRRRVVLYVHLSDAAITGRTAAVDGAEDGTRDVARLENLDRPVTIAQVRAWCATPNAQITVKPVIDLADQIRVNQYEIPDRIKEHVGLRDGGCAFPWCTRRAVGRTGNRPLDHDHVHPHATGGPTSTDNMTPLCRQHHRLKTHGRWQLRIIEPGTYRWRSPRGDTYLKDHTGTHDTGPPETPEPGD